MLTANRVQQRKKRLLIVEDERVTKEVLINYFTDEGFSVLAAENGDEMQTLMEEHAVDLVLLDIVLPGRDGYDLAQFLRRYNPAVGIILYSSKKMQDIDKILGLEIGADDYITKPFSMRELLARIKAVLRRCESGLRDLAGPSCAVHFQGWEFDIAAQCLRSPQGEVIHLPNGECLLLNELIRQAGKVCAREQLLSSLERAGCGGSNYRSLDVQVSRLRQKLQDKQHDLIATVHGKGYAFRAQLT